MTSDPGRLQEFISVAKRNGVADDFLVALLKQNGWSERRIYAAFSLYYSEALATPVPARSGPVEYARDAFLYLLAFISLACWTTAVGHLFYVLIDHWFPDAANPSYYGFSVRGEVSLELATIIIAFPLFIAVSRMLARALRERPDLLDSGVRKWLTYIALVVAAIIILGDGIWFLEEFLRGELTVRFALKSLVLLVLAGGVFAYYLSSMRTDVDGAVRDRSFAAAAGVVVLASLVLGFFNVGTPQHARQVSLDERRSGDLQNIAEVIHERYAAEKSTPFTLPKSLDDFALPATCPQGTSYYAHCKQDPETGVPYAYQPEPTGTKYRLCATFASPSEQRPDDPWAHPAGRKCFSLDASREPAPVPE